MLLWAKPVARDCHNCRMSIIATHAILWRVVVKRVASWVVVIWALGHDRDVLTSLGHDRDMSSSFLGTPGAWRRREHAAAGRATNAFRGRDGSMDTKVWSGT